jgi:hypothetical protein
MGLLQQNQQQYYSGGRKSFTGDGTTVNFTVANSLNAFPAGYNRSNIKVYFDDVLQLAVDSNGVNFAFSYSNANGWNVFFATAPSSGVTIVIDVESNFGNYQYVTLSNIINNFMISYVGRDKLINNIDRVDVIFHAQRALQELSYDTLKSIKSQEIQVPTSLKMILPQDYVNYVKLAWKDGSGIEHIIYPTSKTSNPSTIKQDSDGNYSFDVDDDTSVPIGERDDTMNLIDGIDSDTWSTYKGTTSSENQDDTYWAAGGERYGLDPQYAQTNGSFYIDEIKGLIHFSSNMSGKTIILKYISDGLGQQIECRDVITSVGVGGEKTNVVETICGEEGVGPILHKFAEEAAYKWIAYAILATRINTPEHIVLRFKKEKFAEIRKAKLRLSNIKLEELTQTLRGKSKQIKH